MDILKSQKSEIVLTIVVNFLSDIISIGALMWGLYLHDVPIPIACIIFPIMAFRVVILPIYYNWLEKRTQNELIRNFIENLKHNFKTKIIMLFPVSYMFTYISFCFIGRDISFIFMDLGALSIVSIIFGAMGNYLFLFFYWFVVDLYKKKKQKNKKN